MKFGAEIKKKLATFWSVVENGCSQANSDHLLVSPLHFSSIEFFGADQSHVLQFSSSAADFVCPGKNFEGFHLISFCEGRISTFSIILIKLFDTVQGFFNAAFNISAVEVERRNAHHQKRIFD